MRFRRPTEPVAKAPGAFSAALGFRDHLRRAAKGFKITHHRCPTSLRSAARPHRLASFNVQPIRVSERPRDKEKFSNLKAELYWGLRMRFQAGDVAGLVDERAISQLATIRYSYNARGQLVIESKEDARKRGVKSPDRAEAIMLAFADMEPGIIKYYEQEIHRYEDAADRGLPEPEPLEDDMSRIYEETLRELQQRDEK